MISSKKQTTLPPGIEVKTLDQVQLGESTTTLVHGDSKSGKTFFLGTAGSRALYIYFTVGEGISTLQSPAFRNKYRNYNPITVAIEEQTTAAAFDAVGRTIDFMVDTRRSEFDIVIVDEMTAFRRAAMRKGLELSGIEKRSTTQAQTEQRVDLPPGFFFPKIQDYGAEMNLVEWWTATYTDDAKKQGYHLLVAAHSRNIYEKLGNKPNDPEVLVKVKPGFTGKTFPDDITAYYDSVFYMQRSGKGTNAQHKLIIHGDETYLAGTRYGGVFKENGREVSSITNPDFLKMLKLIQESGIKPGGKLV